MNLLIIPGNSLPNKTEAEEMAELFAPLFDVIEIVQYAHWATNEPLIDFEAELNHVREIGSRFKPDVVLGKSVGVTLAARAIYEGYLSPNKCLFLGSSLPWAQKNGFDPDKWLEGFSISTLFIQQTDDRTMSYEALAEYLPAHHVTNEKLVRIAGEDHMYPADEGLRGIVAEFIGATNDHMVD